MIKAKLCWVCNKYEADSKEHFIKVSDIKMTNGVISSNNPMYKQINFKNKTLVRSSRSNLLTFKNRICSNCNNVVFQPYDEAWNKLSHYLYKNFEYMKRHQTFNANDVFGLHSEKMMKNIQLYFTKIFGCYIKDINLLVEPKMKINFQRFSKSLLNKKRNKIVFLSFGYNPNIKLDETHYEFTQISSLVNKRSHKISKAYFFYSFGRIVVGISYLDTGSAILDWWNPFYNQSIIKFSDLSQDIESLKNNLQF